MSNHDNHQPSSKSGAFNKGGANSQHSELERSAPLMNGDNQKQALAQADFDPAQESGGFQQGPIFGGGSRRDDILELLQRHPEWSNSKIGRSLGIPKSTVARTAKFCEERALLARPDYRVGLDGRRQRIRNLDSPPAKEDGASGGGADSASHGGSVQAGQAA